MIRHLFFGLLALVAFQTTEAQILDPIQWEWTTSTESPKVGEEITLAFNLKAELNWYVYATGFDPDCGPNAATFTFEEDPSFELVGEIRSIDAKEKYDKIFECNVITFSEQGRFEQTISVKTENLHVKGFLEFQTCNEVTGLCLPPKEVDFEFLFASTGQDVFNADESESPIMEETPIVIEEFSNLTDTTLMAFVLIAFLSGLAALLTPCVFPMIPMTVTFFLKDNHEKKGSGIRNGVIFGISIIVIYSVLGTAFAFIFGADSLNAMATHWLPNLFAFSVFFIFSLSFLGMFEIVLPASIVNKIDQKSDKGGLIGIFFMAFTLALVSFSCTFPIVGLVLALSAQGAFIKPILGMVSFSLALALPFTLFAIFPQVLKSLPKSGGWLNSVKVVLGFLELALGLKFLSVADLAYHWGILDREVYLAAWIVIFALMGFYLLGKIHLPHDSVLERISIPRLILATVVFSFVVYLIPGMFGAPLKGLAGYLPPMHTMDTFGKNSSDAATGSQNEQCATPKYADLLHFPHGLGGYFDLDQAIECAKSTGKPIFIDFTGHGCVNCRKMEEFVWSDPLVLPLLRDKFILTALYVDDKTVLPEEEWYTSEVDGRLKKSIGKQNADYQIKRFANNAQPFYIILDSEGNFLHGPRDYNSDVVEFANFLKEGINKFESLK